jgi:carbonic anhydrase
MRRADGTPYRMVGTSVDITERKRSADQFRLALEAATTGMLMVTRTGTIVLVNAHVERLFGYRREELIFNNGHTIEVETEGVNVLTLSGVEYELDQFHFHTPSEHRFASLGFDMAMHLVHKSAAGDTAVVGMFLTRGGSSGSLSTVFGNLPAVDAPLNRELRCHRSTCGPFSRIR